MMSYSLIIPIYNEQKTLKSLIKQLKDNIDEQIEVIIVDDGSDDNTKKFFNMSLILKKFIIKRTKVKGNPLNLGWR